MSVGNDIELKQSGEKNITHPYLNEYTYGDKMQILYGSTLSQHLKSLPTTSFQYHQVYNAHKVTMELISDNSIHVGSLLQPDIEVLLSVCSTETVNIDESINSTYFTLSADKFKVHNEFDAIVTNCLMRNSRDEKNKYYCQRNRLLIFPANMPSTTIIPIPDKSNNIVKRAYIEVRSPHCGGGLVVDTSHIVGIDRYSKALYPHGHISAEAIGDKVKFSLFDTPIDGNTKREHLQVGYFVFPYDLPIEIESAINGNLIFIEYFIYLQHTPVIHSSDISIPKTLVNNNGDDDDDDDDDKEEEEEGDNAWFKQLIKDSNKSVASNSPHLSNKSGNTLRNQYYDTYPYINVNDNNEWLHEIDRLMNVSTSMNIAIPLYYFYKTQMITMNLLYPIDRCLLTAIAKSGRYVLGLSPVIIQQLSYLLDENGNRIYANDDDDEFDVGDYYHCEHQFDRRDQEAYRTHPMHIAYEWNPMERTMMKSTIDGNHILNRRNCYYITGNEALKWLQHNRDRFKALTGVIVVARM